MSGSSLSCATIYKLWPFAFPFSTLPVIALLGNSAVVIVHTNTPPPARYKTSFGPLLSKFAATNGATMLASLPQKLATPDAVPLTGAGNASGVQP